MRSASACSGRLASSRVASGRTELRFGYRRGRAANAETASRPASGLATETYVSKRVIQHGLMLVLGSDHCETVLRVGPLASVSVHFDTEPLVGRGERVPLARLEPRL